MMKGEIISIIVFSKSEIVLLIKSDESVSSWKNITLKITAILNLYTRVTFLKTKRHFVI